MDDFEAVRAAFDAGEPVYPADDFGGEYPGDFGGECADPRTPDFDDPGADPAALLAGECARFPLNDYGNGRRFVSYFGADVINVPRVSWFKWSGRVWLSDDDQLETRRLAQRVSEKITLEAGFLRLEEWEERIIEAGDLARDDLAELREIKAKDRTESQAARLKELIAQVDAADALKKKLATLRRGHHSHAKASGDSGKITNMMREAQVALYRDLKTLNADPLMINTENCVLSIREGAHEVTGCRVIRVDRQDHARELFLSKMMNVEYDPAATCPNFDRFLVSIQPCPKMREFLQRWHGYSLTGLTTEQKLAFYYGGGRNGKSTLVDLIAKMMGEYATTVPIESLAGSEQRKGSDATPDLVRLPGARMVRASEPEKGQKFKEALIKQLTGGEEILVRRMQQEFVGVVPEFSLTIQGNYRPEIRGTDHGIWRRILLIPFLVQIPDEDVDPLLPAKLWAERNGIFNWLLEGARKWVESGLMVPDEVLEATREYREESDPVLVFLNECCVIDGDPGTFIKGKDLAEAFNWWYNDTGRGDPWGSRTIANHLKDKSKSHKSPSGHGFTPKKISDTGYGGIRLTDEFITHREDTISRARYGADE